MREKLLRLLGTNEIVKWDDFYTGVFVGVFLGGMTVALAVIAMGAHT
jgi:hypothetical protein